MVNIEIDGKALEVPQGSMVIEAADKAGISIPRFCYHRKLSIAANCRMCLVDVEKAPKPLPACATPVSEGMKVFTQSPRARMAQKAVMEFLLINHPLDCPICDQGGQCDLQDVALSYGGDVSKFTEGKRSVAVKDIGPLIRTDMTRCIHCTRCVRFGTEVAGIREMGATGRGEFSEIGTFVEQSVDSELSGNIIDLCPVGALTSKPFRYRARAWELQSHPGVAAHDSMGSNIYYHTQHGKVLRVVPRENADLNEVWLSDRDRFSYEANYHQDRVTEPMIKQNGQWQTVDWETALVFAADKLTNIEQQGVDQIGCLMSPNCSLEEYYLAQKMLREKGCANIDYRLRQTDFEHQDYLASAPTVGFKPQDLNQADSILLLGIDCRKEQPLLNAQIRKAHESGQGAKIFALQPYHMQDNFDLNAELVLPAGDLVNGLLQIMKALSVDIELDAELAQKVVNIEVLEPAKQIAAGLQAKRSHIIYGQFALNHPHASVIAKYCDVIARITQSSAGEVSFGVNAAGASLAGAVPHRGAFGVESQKGLSAFDMCQHPRKGFILVQCEPEHDFASPRLAVEAMHRAECVIALTTFTTRHMLEYADCILPLTPGAESEGTYVNHYGQWQSYRAAVKPVGQSKPGWKVLRVLGECWGVNEVAFDTQSEILAECQDAYKNMHHKQNQLDSFKLEARFEAQAQSNQLIRVAPVPIYHVDPSVRRAQSLQKTNDAKVAKIQLHSKTCQKLSLTEGQSVKVKQDGKITGSSFAIICSDDLPEQIIHLPLGIPEVVELGASFGFVELEPA
jgi:NADH-quinone oxidoreductase subunit G